MSTNKPTEDRKFTYPNGGELSDHVVNVALVPIGPWENSRDYRSRERLMEMQRPYTGRGVLFLSSYDL